MRRNEHRVIVVIITYMKFHIGHFVLLSRDLHQSFKLYVVSFSFRYVILHMLKIF